MASQYWTQVRIDAAGNCRFEEILPAKTFFRQSFPEFTIQNGDSDPLDHRLIQHQLIAWMRGEQGSINSDTANLAKRCLKCFISYQTYQACRQLVAQFSVKHGFTISDLLPYVLDDNNTSISSPTNSTSSYQSLQRHILESFDPNQSSLATWTRKLVKHHQELNRFLLGHGLYLVSDWAILNDTNTKQLRRIFSEIYHLTENETNQAVQLLESYQAVYRAERLRQCQAGNRGRCLPPTTEQLQQIAEGLSISNQPISAPSILSKLQKIAAKLRKYRIYVRSKTLPTESINELNHETMAVVEFIDNHEEPDEQNEFLQRYRQEFLKSLDEALEKVTQDKFNYLNKKDAAKASKFLKALKLFHCQRYSMTEIAPMVNLPAQCNVSRLLKLDSFREDVRQRWLRLLRECVFEQAKAYISPERHQQIKEAIDEQINRVIIEGEREASTPKANQTTQSLFSERLCHLLDVMGTQK